MTHEAPRTGSRRWIVAGVLLLATAVNYMDRQTLASLSVRVTTAFELSQEQYGNLEFAFGWAFAAGSLLFGFLADKINVRWLYPAVLLGWSAAGFATGLSTSYFELIGCRTVLGLFEAGHWPCAMATIQRVMDRKDRSLGNGILQSGAAIGAILTPPTVLAILHWADPSGEGRGWQLPFLVIGATGVVWIAVWFAVVRARDFTRLSEPDPRGSSVVGLLFDRRVLALAVMVTCLNATWQLVRAWLPKFLIQGRCYLEADALWFNSAYYIAADAGCLAAGAVALALTRRGWDVHRSRLTVFGACAALSSLTIVASLLPAGWPLLGILLLVGAGTLGLFPFYYSLVQELSVVHVGKISGLLAAFGWFVSSPLQKSFGWLVDKTGSFDLGLALAGLPPLVALAALLVLWRK